MKLSSIFIRGIIALASQTLIAASAAEERNQIEIHFIDLPYCEGTLYIAINDGDHNLLMTALDIDEETETVSIDLAPGVRAVSIRAFQDLNSNHDLDFDTFGRPAEPCLDSKIVITPDKSVYEVTLLEFQ